VKLTTVAAICIALSMSPLAPAEGVTLTTRPKEIEHGTAVRVELLLNAPSNSAPAALQWEFRLPPGLQIAEIEEGKAVKKAGKTLVCNGAKCVVYGLNHTTIPNGQIAVAKIRVTQGFDGAKGFAQVDSQGRNRKQELQIIDLVAASLDGKVIKVVPGSGAPNVSKLKPDSSQ
jgi:hypothetical protein